MSEVRVQTIPFQPESHNCVLVGVGVGMFEFFKKSNAYSCLLAFLTFTDLL